MASPALPLTPVVDVVVIAGPALGTPPQLNQGLIVGNSQVIPYATRLLQFASTSAMLTYGFTNTQPEFLAAEQYFNQTPTAQYVWIGLQCTTSLKTVIPHSGAAGANYKVNDIVLVVQSGGSGGYCQVSAIGGGGSVTSLAPMNQQGGYGDGTGYSVATDLSTTGGSGTGLAVDISAVGETLLTAVTNCRLNSSVWYSVLPLGAAAADIEAIAPYIESAAPVSFLYALTTDSAVLNNTSGNVAATLQAAGYKNTALIYSTTGTYAAAALMGSVMGQNTGLPNSYFTEWGKVLTGVLPEPLTQGQINVINGLNCNVYVEYVNVYTIVQPGITPSGVFIDQTLNRAILQLSIQYSVMNLLYSVPSVPQTDPGMTSIVHAINTACQAAVTTGYLAPGTYKAIQPIVDLQPGDPIPLGFITQPAYPIAQQPAANYAARQAVPMYTVINEAGAVQSATISVLVNLPQ